MPAIAEWGKGNECRIHQKMVAGSPLRDNRQCHAARQRCGLCRQRACGTSHEYAALNYVNYTYNPHNIFTFRTDYLNDSSGQRTGFKGAFLEWDLGYTHWIGDVVELRPEARYERQISAPNHDITGYAYDNPCYAPAEAGVSTCSFTNHGQVFNYPQNGGKKSQAMLAMDAIFHF